MSDSYNGDTAPSPSVGNARAKPSALRWTLHATDERDGDVLVVRLAGRIGAAGSRLVASRLNDAIERGERRVVLDLEDVDYLSSLGIAPIEAAHSALEALDGCLVLAHPTVPVDIVLRLAGADARVPAEPTRAQAIARARRGAQNAAPQDGKA